MGLGRGVVRAAVVQAAPVIMDKRGTMERIRKLTGEAAEQGARIILFPEAFIPCYPRGLSFGSVVGNRSMGGRKDWARYYENSIDVPGPETEELGKLAAKSGVYLSIGVMDSDNGGQTVGGGGNCVQVFTPRHHLTKTRKLPRQTPLVAARIAHY